ncbi:hypothetical protein FB45DRAFT_801833 [Roridomyces roridus]|uniref:F-box domain-containing protein n=1 Tax=Roridomyces roridus TaxID=1738132 RepID=A0AAD7BB46_9AGAR|nr:hypothetical protein FB45DRAFT_801833 [Roridomyces roridus]
MPAHRMNSSLTLPTELLTEIFQLCDPDLADRDVRYASDIPLMQEHPWLLTRVCQRWRALALSTPWLWRYIDVNISLHSAGVLQLVSLFLERSSPCPITLRLTGLNWYSNTLVLERLISASDRWEHLKLLGSVSMVDALESVRGKLPQLRCLETDVSEMEWGSRPRVIDLFADAPRLRRAVTLRRYGVSYILPWQQLVNYKGPMLNDLEATLERLTKFSRLVTLDMSRTSSEYSESTTEYPIVHLPHLRTLSLRTWSTDPDDVINHLCLPALVSMTIDCSSVDICGAITALVDRSHCTIESITLALEMDEEMDTSLILVLASTPQLKHLVLEASHFSDDLLIGLTPPNVLVPRLETLELRDGKFDQNLLLEMVEARFASGEGALRRLGLSLDVNDIQHELVRRMDVLIDLGFIVERLQN